MVGDGGASITGSLGLSGSASILDTLTVGPQGSSSSGRILIQGRENYLTFKGYEGADSIFTIREDAGQFQFVQGTSIDGTGGTPIFWVDSSKTNFNSCPSLFALSVVIPCTLATANGISNPSGFTI